MPYSNARIVTSSWHLLENFAQSRWCDFCQQRRILVPLLKSPSPMSHCILLHIASNVLSTKWSFSKRTWFPTKQWTQWHSSTVCLREKQQFYVLWSSSCKYGIKVRTTHTQNEIWNWIFRCSEARYLKDMSPKIFSSKLRHLLTWRLKIWKCWNIQLDKNDSEKTNVRRILR